MTDARAQKLLPFAVFVLFTLAAIAPIRNYDFFWHLATGRWIAEHHALPAVDPFAIASEKHAWINGEWLFEIAAYAFHELTGLAGMSIVRALLAAAIFVLILTRTRDVLVTAIAFAGAMQTFDLRPSSAAMLFVVLAISARSWIAHAVIAAFWINVHPSALLAPGIALLVTRRPLPVIASALALLVNPHGWRAIVSPLELMSFVQSGAFVNAEWLPSGITRFPLLYLLILGGAAAFIAKRDEWWRALLFAGFAFLAIRHVRNQPLFFAAFPLLVPRFELRRSIQYAGAAAAIVLVALTTDHRLGVAPERFPLTAVARLKATGFRGNIYNPDQFGGFVIWSFYPERRALTDGRNELYRAYIPEYGRARGDERAWRALLRKYAIDLAVDEHRAPLPVIDGRTGRRRELPASLVYWPNADWAMIAIDEAGMVFARRAAFAPEAIATWELPR
ncbi:MAG TPA: hypothetical protein VF911_06030 [Thermoanaerobaculia bacterium]